MLISLYQTKQPARLNEYNYVGYTNVLEIILVYIFNAFRVCVYAYMYMHSLCVIC